MNLNQNHAVCYVPEDYLSQAVAAIQFKVTM